MSSEDLKTTEILMNILYKAIDATSKSHDDKESMHLVISSIVNCAAIGAEFYVPIVMRPITIDSDGYNALYERVDEETESNRSFILRPAADVNMDCFMAFIHEDDVNKKFPNSPYIRITLPKLYQELLKADIVEGVCFMTMNGLFNLATNDLITFTIEGQITARGWQD